MPAASRLDRWALFALLVGLALRVGAPFAMDVWEDGGEYVAMGHALAANGTLWLPFGEERTVAPPTGAPGFSHHYPPAFPAWLAAFDAALGPSIRTTQVALAALGVASVLVVLLCARDLYGGSVALRVASLVALEPHLLWTTGRGYAENLVVALFALTLWAILRALHDERWMVPAGLFAGLSYLAKASLGPFFLVAGLAGLAWRLWHRGAAPLRSPWYLAGAALFGAIVAAWSWRNWTLFGDPVTSPYIAVSYDAAFARPGAFAAALAAKAGFFLLGVALVAAPLAGALREPLRRWRDEATSALLLALALVVALAIVATGALAVFEPDAVLVLDHHRYLLPALVPLLWLARGGTPRGWAVLAAAALVLSAACILAPQKDGEARAAEAAAAMAAPGDALAVHGITLYEPYPFVAGSPLRVVPEDGQARFLLAREPVEASGYHLLGVYHERAWLHADRPGYLYARD